MPLYRFSFDSCRSRSISIHDNGTGIKGSDVSNITEPYFTTKKGNSGLGLSITKKIIDDHNGSILIKNLKSGDGIDIFAEQEIKNLQAKISELSISGLIGAGLFILFAVSNIVYCFVKSSSGGRQQRKLEYIPRLDFN